MRRKLIIPLILSTLILLACNCNLLRLPSSNPTSTPTLSSPSSTQTPANPHTVTPGPPPPVSTGEAPFNISWEDYSLFQQGLTTSYQHIPETLAGASVYHLAFSLADPPSSARGVEEVRYTNQENVDLTEVDFAIFPEILGGSIEVSDVQLDGQPVASTLSPGLMRVPLGAPLEPGQSVVFHIEFEVTIPTLGGDYYYGIFGYNEGIFSLAHAYPTILVYNEDGWNNQTPDLDGDPLFSDASFYLVSINAPANLTLVGAGVEVDRSETAGRQKVLYADGPARDFYLAASADFVKQSEENNGITINSYAPAELNQYAHAAIKTAEAAIDDFNRRYAPYPYTEFDIVPIVTSAGGVEFPGMTAVAKNVYGGGSFLEVVVTHEVGHQWFYNLVGNETQQQPWLDESLAEFVTWQYFLDRYGSQAAQSYRDELQYTWDTVNDDPLPIGMPVSGYTSDEYVAIVYGRGAFFFLALRDQIGQTAFDSLMSDYAATYAWKIATTVDFKQLAEQHCACDLTPLFDEWVYP